MPSLAVLSAVAALAAAAVPTPALAEDAGAPATPLSTTATATALPRQPDAAAPALDLSAVGDTVEAAPVHGLTVAASGSEFDATAEIDWKVRLHDYQRGLPRGVELGVQARTGLMRQGFIAGYAVRDGLVSAGRLWGAMRLYRRGALGIDAHIAPGVRVVRGAEGAGPERQGATAVTFDTGVVAHMRASRRLRLHAGLLLPFSYEIAPEVINDVQGALITAGATIDLGANTQAFASVETGGIFGADGDAGKYLTRATAGVRMVLGGDTRAWNGDASPTAEGAAEREGSGSPVFVDVGWRGLALADHLSHGPSFQLGVVLFDHLKLGLAGLQRPGPINSKTFDRELPAGMSYRGQDAVTLRSDGAVFGALIAPMVDIPGAPLRVELPVLVGFAGFGFYLTGDDRDTPDGRRVSEWEDELLEGKDSSFALAVDTGLRIAYVSDAGWWQPYLGVHYLLTPGYDATMASDYGGFSAAAGVQFGAL
ncbi:hypothetical protein [Haliangium sp.]|uniref:hypothetical protein n=1 Tax=Haliangium sp. TaxID=2663208 RepID=UPI003D10FE30